MSKAIDEVLGSSPLVIQLHHELDTFNNLLELIHNTLSQLKLAISGEIIMTGQLEDIYHAILIQQVPAEFKVNIILIFQLLHQQLVGWLVSNHTQYTNLSSQSF